MLKNLLLALLITLASSLPSRVEAKPLKDCKIASQGYTVIIASDDPKLVEQLQSTYREAHLCRHTKSFLGLLQHSYTFILLMHTNSIDNDTIQYLREALDPFDVYVLNPSKGRRL